MARVFMQVVPIGRNLSKVMTKKTYMSYIDQVWYIVNNYQESAISLLNHAVTYWVHQPDFFILRNGLKNSQRYVMSIKTNSFRFQMVDVGTESRNVKVSRNWKSKSNPFKPLVPSKGQGTVIRGKNIEEPGIKARNFYYAVQRILDPKFEADIESLLFRTVVIW
jgi:hypothetical protein